MYGLIDDIQDLRAEVAELKEERETLRNVGAFYLKETTNLRLKLKKIKKFCKEYPRYTEPIKKIVESK